MYDLFKKTGRFPSRIYRVFKLDMRKCARKKKRKMLLSEKDVLLVLRFLKMLEDKYPGTTWFCNIFNTNGRATRKVIIRSWAGVQKPFIRSDDLWFVTHIFIGIAGKCKSNVADEFSVTINNCLDPYHVKHLVTGTLNRVIPWLEDNAPATKKREKPHIENIKERGNRYERKSIASV